MMDSGIPTDPDGNVIANDPGAVVVRVYRVQPDGRTLRDIGGALVAPDYVNRVRQIAAALAGVLGTEIVRLVTADVHGAGETPAADTVQPPPPDDLWADFLKELGDGSRNPNAK